MQWIKPKISGSPPPSLHKHSAVLIDNKIYIIGGSYLSFDPIQNKKVDIFNSLIVLDTETMYWYYPACTGDIPPHRRSHTATAVDDRIFVFGGGDGPNYFNDLYILDTKTMDWKKAQSSGQQPSPRRAHTAVLSGTKLYIFGGGDGSFPLNETYVLDTEKLHWSLVSTKGSIPDPRGFHSANLANDKIVVYGGSDTQNCFSDLFVFDTTDHSWSKKKLSSAKCRYAHASAIVGPWMCIFGGSDGAEWLPEFNVLNLTTMDWVKVEVGGNVPSARGYHSIIFHDSRLFVFGGATEDKFFSDMYVLELGVHAYVALQPAKLL